MPYPEPTLYPEPSLYPDPGVVAVVEPDPELDAWIPSPSLVAKILRARIVTAGGAWPSVGGRLRDFTDDTTPTRDDVADLIDMHAPLVLMRTGPLGEGELHCSDSDTLRLAVATIIAQRVALAIEESFAPEEYGESSVANTDAFREQIGLDLEALVTAIERCRNSSDDGGDGGESDSRSDPAWLFPPSLRLRY